MFVFDLPEVGEGVIEGELVKWLVSIGDSVTEDQPICELMTDKATIEITSPKSGVVHKLYCDVGDIIEVHTPLIEIDTAGGSPPVQASSPPPVRTPEPKASTSPTPVLKPASALKKATGDPLINTSAS